MKVIVPEPVDTAKTRQLYFSKWDRNLLVITDSIHRNICYVISPGFSSGNSAIACVPIHK